MVENVDFISAAASADAEKARQKGLAFIDGSIPGYALLLGGNAEDVKPVIEELVRHRIVVFILEEALQDSLQEKGLTLGWESGIVPLDITRALGCITRIAQIFGNVEKPDEVLDFAREKLLGFTLLLDEPTPQRLSAAEAALPFGCPVISTHDLSQIAGEWEWNLDGKAAVGKVDLREVVQAGIEERRLQIQVPLPDMPVAYSSDFSGQVVPDDSCGVCLTGTELVITGKELTDGRVVLEGLDLADMDSDDHPYAMLIEVGGPEMQPDFEPVLERQIETIVNDLDGVTHRGQRAMATLRFARAAVEKGLSLRHLGELLHAQLHNEYGNIVTRVQVSIYTVPDQLGDIQARAREVYETRDSRLKNLKDEDVDTFYTCNLCQTIAAGHLCVISPERPGACGAVDWMDARAAVSIKPVGHNKAVKKEGILDARLGQWESVNQIAKKESGGAIEAYSLYSLMQDPGSACGDFECITSMLPLTNGVMVVAHAYEGLTPSGMDWTTLYEMVGSGAPMPGFLGHSKRALASAKFISAEGGWQRIVWMSHALREEMRPVLEELAAAAGMPGFVDMIATEQVGVDEDQILPFLEEAGHPALAMDPML